MSASSPTQSATDRGPGLWTIVAWAGLLLAGALYMVDPFEPFSCSAEPICFLAADGVEPGSLVEEAVNGATAIYDVSDTQKRQSGYLVWIRSHSPMARCWTSGVG